MVYPSSLKPGDIVYVQLDNEREFYAIVDNPAVQLDGAAEVYVAVEPIGVHNNSHRSADPHEIVGHWPRRKSISRRKTR